MHDSTEDGQNPEPRPETEKPTGCPTRAPQDRTELGAHVTNRMRLNFDPHLILDMQLGLSNLYIVWHVGLLITFCYGYNDVKAYVSTTSRFV